MTQEAVVSTGLLQSAPIITALLFGTQTERDLGSRPGRGWGAMSHEQNTMFSTCGNGHRFTKLRSDTGWMADPLPMARGCKQSEDKAPVCFQ